MLHRAGINSADRLLVNGASGGVGSAVVQLAKRRGAYVIAVTGESKLNSVRGLGADQVIARGLDLSSVIEGSSVDVVIDNVAGEQVGGLLKLMSRGGRYASSGAIAGPVVTFDIRQLYLKDLTLIGCTAWDEPVFSNLIDYIEKGEIRPLVAKTFELRDMARAQQEFLKKNISETLSWCRRYKSFLSTDDKRKGIFQSLESIDAIYATIAGLRTLYRSCRSWTG